MRMQPAASLPRSSGRSSRDEFVSMCEVFRRAKLRRRPLLWPISIFWLLPVGCLRCGLSPDAATPLAEEWLGRETGPREFVAGDAAWAAFGGASPTSGVDAAAL